MTSIEDIRFTLWDLFYLSGLLSILCYSLLWSKSLDPDAEKSLNLGQAPNTFGLGTKSHLGQGPNRISVRDQISFGLVTKTHLGQEATRIWVRGQTL